MLKELLKKPSIMGRLAIGKTVGFVVGLIGFIVLPMIWDGSTLMLQWGILLWYTTVGAFIGVFGVINYHPILHMPLPWWFRGPWIGGWMNFILTLFAYDTFALMMAEAFGGYFAGYSPFWFACEGAIVGLLISWFATRFGGEGAETVTQQ